MISKYNHKNLNWIDLESGTKEEINHILEEYSVPKNIIEKITKNDKDGIFELNHDYIYASIDNKITFIVNDNYIISIHDEPILAFNASSKELEIDMITIDKISSNKILFAYLLKNIFKNREEGLSSSYTQIEQLKKKVLLKNKIIKNRNILIIILIIIFIITICL